MGDCAPCSPSPSSQRRPRCRSSSRHTFGAEGDPGDHAQSEVDHRRRGSRRVVRRTRPLLGGLRRRPALRPAARDASALPLHALHARVRHPSGAGGTCSLGRCSRLVHDLLPLGRSPEPAPDAHLAPTPGSERSRFCSRSPREPCSSRRAASIIPVIALLLADRRRSRSGVEREAPGSREGWRSRRSRPRSSSSVHRARDLRSAWTASVPRDDRSRRPRTHPSLRALGRAGVHRRHGPASPRRRPRRLGGSDPDRWALCSSICFPRNAGRSPHSWSLLILGVVRPPAAFRTGKLDGPGVHAGGRRLPLRVRVRAGRPRRLPRVSGEPDRVGVRLPPGGEDGGFRRDGGTSSEPRFPRRDPRSGQAVAGTVRSLEMASPVSGSKKWKRLGSTAQPHPFAGFRARARVDPRAELGAFRDQGEDVVGPLVARRRERLLGGHGRRVDGEQHVHLRAELLGDVHLDVDGRSLRSSPRRPRPRGRTAGCPGSRSVPRGPRGRSPRRAERGSRAKEIAPPSTVPSTRFIGGDPTNAATNRFAGRANSRCGVSTCWRRPSRRTATRSPRVIASTWSWVT